jgi:hypothetical protein
VIARQAFAWRLASAQQGAAAVEFAIVAPVFLLLLLGIFDIGQMAYAKAVLQGAVEQAARSGTLETANVTIADDIVKNPIRPILPNATFTMTRKSYYDFNDVARPEKFTDSDHDGNCDHGEPFVDENRSGSWDADIGRAGNGGAGDVVLYTVTMTYKPIFTLTTMGNDNASRTLTAVGVRKNQPFATQTAYGSGTGTCP